MMLEDPRISRVYGVDFSGANDAGKRIWISSGIVQGTRLRVDRCFSARELPNSGVERKRCLTALRAFISEAGPAVFGIDFPFGLPHTIVSDLSWRAFVAGFGDRFDGPDAFRKGCQRMTNGTELKRQTDVEAKTPFSPYNLRIYKQTFFGIRDVVGQLVADDLICVLPMDGPPTPGRPWVIEICPASTLKKYKLYGASRRITLDVLAGPSSAVELPEEVRQVVLDQTNDDALDSLVAVEATFRAINDPSIRFAADGPYRVEGCVFV